MRKWSVISDQRRGLRRLALRLVGDGAAAFGVVRRVVDPGSHVSKAAAADREGVFERRWPERIGLGNPFEDSAVGIEQGQKAIGRRVRLVFDAFGIDPANGLI